MSKICGILGNTILNSQNFTARTAHNPSSLPPTKNAVTLSSTTLISFLLSMVAQKISSALRLHTVLPSPDLTRHYRSCWPWNRTISIHSFNGFRLSLDKPSSLWREMYSWRRLQRTLNRFPDYPTIALVMSWSSLRWRHWNALSCWRLLRTARRQRHVLGCARWSTILLWWVHICLVCRLWKSRFIAHLGFVSHIGSFPAPVHRPARHLS